MTSGSAAFPCSQYQAVAGLLADLQSAIIPATLATSQSDVPSIAVRNPFCTRRRQFSQYLPERLRVEPIE